LLAAPLRLAVLPGDTALTRQIVIRQEGGFADDWTPQATAPWVSVRRLGNILQVTADPTGLAAGVYTDTIHLVLPARTAAETSIKAVGDVVPGTSTAASTITEAAAGGGAPAPAGTPARAPAATPGQAPRAT